MIKINPSLGRGYALKAYTINENSFEALRWTAVLTGAATEFLGVRERIREGKVFTVRTMHISLLKVNFLKMRFN